MSKTHILVSNITFYITFTCENDYDTETWHNFLFKGSSYLLKMQKNM